MVLYQDYRSRGEVDTSTSICIWLRFAYAFVANTVGQHASSNSLVKCRNVQIQVRWQCTVVVFTAENRN